MMIIGAETEIGQGLGHPSTRRGAIAQDHEREEDTNHAVGHHETGDAADEAALEIETTGETEGGGKESNFSGEFFNFVNVLVIDHVLWIAMKTMEDQRSLKHETVDESKSMSHSVHGSLFLFVFALHFLLALSGFSSFF